MKQLGNHRRCVCGAALVSVRHFAGKTFLFHMHSSAFWVGLEKESNLDVQSSNIHRFHVGHREMCVTLVTFYIGKCTDGTSRSSIHNATQNKQSETSTKTSPSAGHGNY